MSWDHHLRCDRILTVKNMLKGLGMWICGIAFESFDLVTIHIYDGSEGEIGPYVRRSRLRNKNVITLYQVTGGQNEVGEILKDVYLQYGPTRIYSLHDENYCSLYVINIYIPTKPRERITRKTFRGVVRCIICFRRMFHDLYVPGGVGYTRAMSSFRKQIC